MANEFNVKYPVKYLKKICNQPVPVYSGYVDTNKPLSLKAVRVRLGDCIVGNK